MMKGVSLIEVVVGAAIVSLILLALGSIAQFSIGIAKVATERLEAAFLASETIEAVKLMRDSSWSLNIAPLAAGTTYYLDFNGSLYKAISASQPAVDGKFNRSFVLEDVFRNSTTDDIAPTGTLDPGTQRVNATVQWTSRGIIKTEVVSTYIANIFNN